MNLHMSVTSHMSNLQVSRNLSSKSYLMKLLELLTIFNLLCGGRSSLDCSRDNFNFNSINTKEIRSVYNKERDSYIVAWLNDAIQPRELIKCLTDTIWIHYYSDELKKNLTCAIDRQKKKAEEFLFMIRLYHMCSNECNQDILIQFNKELYDDFIVQQRINCDTTKCFTTPTTTKSTTSQSNSNNQKFGNTNSQKYGNNNNQNYGNNNNQNYGNNNNHNYGNSNNYSYTDTATYRLPPMMMYSGSPLWLTNGPLCWCIYLLTVILILSET